MKTLFLAVSAAGFVRCISMANACGMSQAADRLTDAVNGSALRMRGQLLCRS